MNETAAPAQFTLDQAAGTWLAAAIAQSDRGPEFTAAAENLLTGGQWDGALPDIGSTWAPARDLDGDGVSDLVDKAQVAGIIHAPPNMAVAFDFGHDSDGPGYRWLADLGAGPGRGPVLAGSHAGLRTIGGGCQAQGAAAALAVLREAVAAANGCLADLEQHHQARGTAAGRLAVNRVLPSAQQEADRRALDAIQHMLRDPDWAPGMLEDIAGLVRQTGRDVENLPGDPPTWDRH